MLYIQHTYIYKFVDNINNQKATAATTTKQNYNICQSNKESLCGKKIKYHRIIYMSDQSKSTQNETHINRGPGVDNQPAAASRVQTPDQN